jgi:TP901 family phage tail tape measure protein
MSGLDISFKISALDDFSKTMKNLEKSTSQAFDSVKQAGAVVTAAGAGIAAGLGAAVVKGNAFAGEMARVKAISGATESQFAALKDTALQLGASTTKSAGEVASGMKEMSAMGFEVNEVIAAMPGIIAGAEASGESLARVTEVTAAALNSFGLEASQATHVADVMAMAANASAASVDDLGYAFKYAAPVAKGLGIGMEELAAATAVMTDAGMRGEQAGTTLRSALLRLTDPPKEAAEALKNLGVNVIDEATGKMLPFPEVIGKLGESTAGMGDAAKMAALSQIFGTEAASGMLNVIGAGPEKLNELTNAFINSDGAAKKTAAEGLDPFGRAMEELGGAVETAAIRIRDSIAPALTFLTNLISSAVNLFNNLSPAMQNSIGITAALAAAALLLTGPLLLIIGFLPQIVAGFGMFMTAMSTIGPVIAGIVTGPIGILIAGLVALGAGMVLAYGKVSWFRDMVDSAWSNIKTAFSTALTFIQNITQTVMSVVSGFIGDKLSQIQAFWNENGSMIEQATKNVFNVIKTVITTTMNAVMAIMQFIWPAVKFLIETTWTAIKGVINGALNIIMGVIKAFSALFTGNWSALWDAVKQIIMGALEFVWNLISLMFMGKIVGIFKSFISLGKSLLTNFWGVIKSLFTSSGNAIKNSVSTSFNFIKNIVDSVMGAIRSVVTNIWGTVKTVFTNSVNFAKTAVSNGFNAMKTKVGEIMGGVKTSIQSAWDDAVKFLKSINLGSIGKNIVQGLIDGIAGMAGSLMSKVKEMANLIPDGLKDFLGIKSPINKSSKKTKKESSMIKKLLVNKPTMKVVIA